METQTYTSEPLDHPGLVAGMFQEIGLSKLIDDLLSDKQDTQHVSTGKALEAMILELVG
jgi:hypothetical protein